MDVLIRKDIAHLTSDIMRDTSIDTIYPSSHSPSTPTKQGTYVASTTDLVHGSPTNVSTATIVATPAATPAAATAVAPSTPPEDALPPVLKKLEAQMPAYQSTGLQTRPLKNSAAFVEVYGREPHIYHYEHNLGRAGIGRYKTAGLTPYDLTRSTEFSIPKNSPDVKYVSSSFATMKPKACQAALKLAKAKASIQVANTKWKTLAADQGFKLWNEKRDEKIIHSEQFVPKEYILNRLDNEGKVKEGEHVSSLLPNVYKDDLVSDPPEAAVTHLASPSAILLKISSPSSAPQPIVSLESEDREDPSAPQEPWEPQEPQETEEKTDEKQREWWWSTYGFVPDCNPAYEPGAVDSFALNTNSQINVVIVECIPANGKPYVFRNTPNSDPKNSPVQRQQLPSSTPESAPPAVPTAPRPAKRKGHPDSEEDNGEHRPKRSRALSPERRPHRNEHHYHEDHGREKQRSNSADNQPLPSIHDAGSPPSSPRLHQRPSVEQAQKSIGADVYDDDRLKSRRVEVYEDYYCESRRANDCDGDRRKSHRVHDRIDEHRASRCRSRSPNRSRGDAEKVYRVRYRSRPHNKECDTDPRYVPCKEDQGKSRRRDGRRAHKPQTRDIVDFQETSRLSEPAATPAHVDLGQSHKVGAIGGNGKRHSQQQVAQDAAKPVSAVDGQPDYLKTPKIDWKDKAHSEDVCGKPLNHRQTSKASTPMTGHPEHDQNRATNLPQRRTKRVREDDGSDANKDITPHKRLKTEDKQTHGNATEPVITANLNDKRQQVAPAAESIHKQTTSAARPKTKQTAPITPPKKEKPKRAEMARYQPRRHHSPHKTGEQKRNITDNNKARRARDR